MGFRSFISHTLDLQALISQPWPVRLNWVYVAPAVGCL